MKQQPRFFWAWLMLAAIASFQLKTLARPGDAADLSNRSSSDSLFTNGVLHLLKIEIPRAGMRSLNQEPRSYVPATLREGSTVYSNILIRLKGGAGSFRRLEDKPGLTVKLGEASGVFHGLNKFHLNNSVQDGTYLSEWLCSGMFREAGVPATRAAHAVVELNGRRLGLYVLLESVNQEFLARYFKNPRGNLYGQGPNADITEPLERMGGSEKNSGQDLKTLAAACREPELDQLRIRLPQVLDLERFVSFMALETMLGHWDGYTFNVKNYLVYHNLDAGKLIFIPHDLDQILRSPNEPIMPHAQGAVSRAVLRVPEFRERYRNRFGEIFTNAFVAPVLIQRIDDRAALLASQLKAYDPDLARQLTSQSASLKSRLLNRARNLAVHMQISEPGTLKFAANEARLTGWREANGPENAKLAQVPGASGKKVLWIAATGSTAASWRSKVVQNQRLRE